MVKEMKDINDKATNLEEIPVKPLTFLHFFWISLFVKYLNKN